MNQPHKRVKCPYPGCAKEIRASHKFCKEHSNRKEWAIVPKVGDFRQVRQCKQCGQEFTIRNPKSVYCESCRLPTCKVCGKQFLRNSKTKNLFCSPTCSYASGERGKREATILICDYCTKEFRSKSGHLGTKFCSRACKAAASRKDEPDKKRNSYRYRLWRDAVYKRDNYTCQHCNATGEIQAHHVKEWKDHTELRYEPSNGITLYRTCHENVHGASIPRVAKRFEPHCKNCGITTKGRALYCKSCSMKLSTKAKTQRLNRPRNKDGQYT